jgi:diaminopimelate epimerase
MGIPLLEPEAVPTTLAIGPAGLPQGELEVANERLAVAAAGMGNPHVVIPVADVAAVDLDRLGAALEVHPAFPAKTNVHFVQALSPTHLVMRVWERGAGPTLACGTGACATLVACHRLGLAERRARLDLPGGPLEIAWDGDSGHLFMTGPAEAVFDGVTTPDLWGADPGEALWQEPQVASEASFAAVEPVAVAGEKAVETTIDCATACVSGCLRPEACPSAEARARVEALLNSSSLDELVTLATNSLEARTRARFQADPAPGP